MDKSLPRLSEESANLLQHIENRFDALDHKVTDLGETVDFMKETMVTKDEMNDAFKVHLAPLVTKRDLGRVHDSLLKRLERHEQLPAHR